ncbi:MAG: malto-oligosyltrehalose synthase [Solirubrobacteraceae bacterium]
MSDREARARSSSRPRTSPAPLRATYRLQLSTDFGFAAARSLIPYLRDLGVSHLYLSPSLQARPGSGHGYDVIDPGRLSDALGGEAEFRAMVGAARGAGMGVVLDVVPNHMAADDANRYWADPARRSTFFDVDPETGRHRRFFDIDDLAGVRQEDRDVFEATQAKILELVREGLVDGLRVDHPDGLADPAGYLRRLQEGGAGCVWVEKILAADEPLRDWPVAGTVGYEFLGEVSALFVDPAGETGLTALWEEVTGERRSFDEIALQSKLQQVQSTFQPELERLARELGPQEPGGPDAVDGAWPGGLDVLALALASMGVYRTYVDPHSGLVTDADRRAIGAAQMPQHLREMLVLERAAPRSFVTRFQQTTPAVVAKGVEDTAFYRYARLLCANDVGGDPARFGLDVAAFHAAQAQRARRFPLNLLTTETHDAKRSGDVRARIGALASMPEEWAVHVRRWVELTEPLRTDGAPDDLERYFLFQTLAGAWPITLERIQSYMEKALREAKRNTSWVEQNSDWEAAVKRFLAALLRDEPFLADFEPFVARLAALGDRAALGQVVLKLTVPGIPDIYQGDELPYRALVDPDNRRPVDWRWHQAMLSRLMGGSPPDAATWKLWTYSRLLGLRARRPEPFLGSYEPLQAGEGTCAFVRGGEVLVVLAVRDGSPPGVLEAPRGRWIDVLRGGERSFAPHQPVRGVLGEHSAAVFERVGGGSDSRPQGFAVAPCRPRRR